MKMYAHMQADSNCAACQGQNVPDVRFAKTFLEYLSLVGIFFLHHSQQTMHSCTLSFIGFIDNLEGCFNCVRWEAM